MTSFGFGNILFISGFVLGAIFHPTAQGVFRAVLITINPRKTLEQRNEIARAKNARQIANMSRELENTMPSLASELKMLSSRD